MSQIDPTTARQWVSGTRGKTIKLLTGRDLTAVQSLAIMVRPPETDESTPAIVVTAAVVRDPEDPTVVNWTITSSQIDAVGLYQLRVRASFPGSVTHYSEVPATLEVVAP